MEDADRADVRQIVAVVLPVERVRRVHSRRGRGRGRPGGPRLLERHDVERAVRCRGRRGVVLVRVRDISRPVEARAPGAAGGIPSASRTRWAVPQHSTQGHKQATHHS